MNEEKTLEQTQEAMDIKLWAHEAGRWKGKCVRLQKEIDRLKEDIEGYRQLQMILQSVVDLIVAEVGTVVIHKEALDEAMKSGCTSTMFSWDEDNKTYTFRPLEAEQEATEE